MSANRGLIARGSLAALLALVVSGCSGAQPSPSPSVPGSAAAISPVLDCGSLELRTPQGESIDLSGNWVAGGGTVVLRQHGACVWWVDQADLLGAEVGVAWVRTFTGRVASDFTVTGEWATVFAAPLVGEGEGRATFEIEISVVDDAEVIVLRRISAGAALDDCCGYPVDALTQAP